MGRWDSQLAASVRSRRDEVFVDDDGGYDFWYSSTGQIVRWAVFGGIFLIVILYLILGYMHAKRRIRKGLVPLAYHRFLLNRQERAQYDPNYRNPVPDYYVYRSDEYGMHAYPPPVYDPNVPSPPSYQPPAGASKVDPVQQRESTPRSRPAVNTEPSPEYTPPLGPPPAASLQATHTGPSNTSNNPFRL